MLFCNHFYWRNFYCSKLWATVKPISNSRKTDSRIPVLLLCERWACRSVFTEDVSLQFMIVSGKCHPKRWVTHCGGPIFYHPRHSRSLKKEWCNNTETPLLTPFGPNTPEPLLEHLIQVVGSNTQKIFWRLNFKSLIFVILFFRLA